MKKYTRITSVLMIAVMLLTLAACGKTEQADAPMTTTTISSIQTGTVGETMNDQTATTTTEGAETETTTTGQTKKTKKTEDETTGKKTTTTTGQKKTTTTAKKETKKTTTTTKKVTTTKKKTTTTKAASKWDKVATASDAKVLADRVLYYINQYRNVDASMLPNMRAFAEYRAKQLTTNFAHDLTDSNAAATALKYGRKEQNSTYNFETGEVTYDGTYYYFAGCGEAIGYDEVWGDETIDELAEDIARGYKNSAGHWSYVGRDTNIYVAVGLAYSGGRWYSCICTSDTNQYG